MCGSRKYPYPSHGGLRKFRGVEGSERGKFPKGRGVHKELFFPEGINTYVLFQLILQGNQEKWQILSVEINVRFLVIYFPLLFRRQTTQIALRNSPEQHVRREVKKKKRPTFKDL